MTLNNEKKHILLVEDEILIGMATAQSLDDESFSVSTANSGEKAIALITESPDLFDLILMDIDLGHGMDGTAAAAEILTTKNIPIIFLSSHTENYIVSKTESISSYGYVVKQSGIPVLTASIRMAFRLHNAYTVVEQKTQELTAALEELQTTSEELEATNEQLVESESELQKSEERIRSTMDSMMEGCQILSTDWTYLYINESAARYGRKNKEELLGKSIFECYPDIRNQNIFSILEKCMRGRINCQKEITFEYEDGTKAFFEFSIQPVPEGLFILTYETTERRLIENRIGESEHRFRLLVENSPTGIFIQTKGQFAYINQALKTMLEITDESEIIGQPVINFFADKHKEQVAERIRKLNIDKIPQPALEEIIISLKGNPIRSEVYAVPVFYENEHGALVYVHDISERKKMEDELRNMVQLKDTLMVELQHRVKNSLVIVSSLLSLESSHITDESIKSIFSKAQSRIQTMAGVYEMLYSSPEECIDRIRLDNYIRRLSSTIIDLCGNNDKTRLSYDLDEITIDLKRTVLICLILNELIMNSIKHGCIPDGKSSIHIRLKSSGSHHSLMISNSAVKKDHAENLQSGGIGLTLVNMLIRELRGNISFSYEPEFAVSITIPENI